MEEFLHHPLSYYGQSVKRLGSGSYGTVDAYDGGKYGTPVAVKRELIFGSSALREMSVYRTVKHPNILEAIDMGVLRTPSPGRVTGVDRLKIISTYIVFPLAQGTLEQLLKQWRRDGTTPPINAVKKMMYQLVLGLLELHENGRFVHNDLKPPNVLTFDEGGGNIRPVIADMGFAGRWTCMFPDGNDDRLRGTMWYRAPELLLGSTKSEPASDIWALGMIFYEMLFGEALNASSTEVDAINNIIRRLGAGYDIQKITDWIDMMEKKYSSAEVVQVSIAARDAMKLVKSPSTLEVVRSKLAGDSQNVIDLITQMLEFIPTDRPTIRQIATHPFFASVAGDFAPLPREELDCYIQLDNLELKSRSTQSTNIDEEYFITYVEAADDIQTNLIESETKGKSKLITDLTWRLYIDTLGRRQVQGTRQQFINVGDACFYIASTIAGSPILPNYHVEIEVLFILKLLGFDTYRVSVFDYRSSLPPNIKKIYETYKELYITPTSLCWRHHGSVWISRQGRW